jgi:hypothetical protein
MEALMRAMGSSFLVRQRVVRDFESTPVAKAFLSEHGLKDDVDDLNSELFRIKDAADDRIQDSIYAIFSTDAAKELELKLDSLIRKAIANVEIDSEIKPFISFRPNSDATKLAVSIIYHYKAESVCFNLFEAMPPLSDCDQAVVIERFPRIAWFVDERSPLFSVEHRLNLRLFLLFSRILESQLSKEEIKSLSFFARLIVKKAALVGKNQESIVGKTHPAELAKAILDYSAVIKKASQAAKPTISVSRFYKEVSDECFESVAILSITGSTPFSYILGVRVFNTASNPVIERRSAQVKEGIGFSDWDDLFSNEYLKKNFTPNLHAVRYLLCKFGYRAQTRNSEKFYVQIKDVFPHFDMETDGGDIILSMQNELVISDENASLGSSRFTRFQMEVEQMVETLAAKKVEAMGSLSFELAGTNKESVFFDWSLGEPIQNEKIEFACFEAKVSISIKLKMTERSNLKYLPFIGAVISNIIDGTTLRLSI